MNMKMDIALLILTAVLLIPLTGMAQPSDCDMCQISVDAGTSHTITLTEKDQDEGYDYLGNKEYYVIYNYEVKNDPGDDCQDISNWALHICEPPYETSKKGDPSYDYFPHFYGDIQHLQKWDTNFGPDNTEEFWIKVKVDNQAAQGNLMSNVYYTDAYFKMGQCVVKIQVEGPPCPDGDDGDGECEPGNGGQNGPPYSDEDGPTAVPEMGTFLLTVVGLLGLVGYIVRHKD